MSFVAEFTLDHPNIILGNVIKEFEDAIIRIAYSTTRASGEIDTAFAVVTHPNEWAELDAAFESDKTVKKHRMLFSTPTHAVYEFDWDRDYVNIWDMTARFGIFVERIWANRGVWRLRSHFASRPRVKEFREHVESRGVDITLEMLRAFTFDRANHSGTTDSQLGLLREAFHYGYFDVPRSITQSELANNFDITESAVSQQIRRGLRNVLAEYLSYGPPSTEPVDDDFFNDV